MFRVSSLETSNCEVMFQMGPSREPPVDSRTICVLSNSITRKTGMRRRLREFKILFLSMLEPGVDPPPAETVASEEESTEFCATDCLMPMALLRDTTGQMGWTEMRVVE